MPRAGFNLGGYTTAANALLFAVTTDAVANSTATIRELSLVMNGTPSGPWSCGIGRPANSPAYSGVPIGLAPEDPASPYAVWSIAIPSGYDTAPTVPTNYYRRWTAPAVNGACVTFTFPDGLPLPVDAYLVVWSMNAVTGATVVGHITAEF